jgi:hypothetical protein
VKRISFGTHNEWQLGSVFMTSINKEDTIAKLREIQDKRTHCQCSRDKVIEKIAFDYAIAVVERMPDADMVRKP